MAVTPNYLNRKCHDLPQSSLNALTTIGQKSEPIPVHDTDQISTY